MTNGLYSDLAKQKQGSDRYMDLWYQNNLKNLSRW